MAFRTELVGRAMGYLRLGLTVRETAAHLHVSDRHLRRLMRQELGMSPRQVVGA